MNSDTTVGDVSEFLFVEMLDGGRCSSVFSLRKQPFCPVQIVVLVEGEIEGRVSIASNAGVNTLGPQRAKSCRDFPLRFAC